MTTDPPELRAESSEYAVYVYLRPGKHSRTVGLSDAVNVDLDEDGNALGVEFLR